MDGIRLLADITAFIRGLTGGYENPNNNSIECSQGHMYTWVK